MSDQPVPARPVETLATTRQSYEAGTLDESSIAPTWLEQLRDWYDQAAAVEAIAEPNAMQIATVDATGRPDVRTVLARGFDADGIVFYTNYDSAKGRELAENPYAAGVFAWLPLQRQARFRGPVARVSAAESAAYFASRPAGSQLAAWASPQSEVIKGRAELGRRLAEVTERFDGEPVPVPPFWGGYRITVTEMEFWQGRPSRLHDRLRYRPASGQTGARPADGGTDSAWFVERLAP